MVGFFFANESRKKNVLHTRTHATNADDHTSHADNNRSLKFSFDIFFSSSKKKGFMIIQLFDERKKEEEEEMDLIGFAYSSK